MGYNTNITILNDALPILREYPQQLVEGINQHLMQGGSFPVGNHCNPVHMQPSMHADATQLIACGGNFSTLMHVKYFGPSHHTDEGRLALLKSWAKEMGYDLRKRPQ